MDDDVIFEDSTIIPVPDTDGRIRHDVKVKIMEMFVASWEEIEEAIMEGSLKDNDKLKMALTVVRAD